MTTSIKTKKTTMKNITDLILCWLPVQYSTQSMQICNIKVIPFTLKIGVSISTRNQDP